MKFIELMKIKTVKEPNQNEVHQRNEDQNR
jgi:hypothetical protein